MANYIFVFQCSQSSFDKIYWLPTPSTRPKSFTFRRRILCRTF